jgi:hypothetical protein
MGLQFETQAIDVGKLIVRKGREILIQATEAIPGILELCHDGGVKLGSEARELLFVPESERRNATKIGR